MDSWTDWARWMLAILWTALLVDWLMARGAERATKMAKAVDDE